VEGNTKQFGVQRCQVSRLSRQCLRNRCTFFAASLRWQHGRLDRSPGHIQHKDNIH